jgi:hypothetical protein
MKYMVKRNRLHSNWGPSYLYLRKHAQEQAIKRFGSLRALDEEKHKRSRKILHRNIPPAELYATRRGMRDKIVSRRSSPLSSSTIDNFPSSSSSAKALNRRWNASTKTMSSVTHSPREPDFICSRRSSPRSSLSPTISSPPRCDAESTRSERLSSRDNDMQALKVKIRAEQAEEVKILSDLVRENTALIRNMYRKLVIALSSLLIFLLVYLLFFVGVSDNNAIIQRVSLWLNKRALVSMKGCVAFYLDALYASIYYCTRDLYAYLLRHQLINSLRKYIMPS